MAAQFFAGGTAGVIQWLPPIYCLDVIKSRMQTAPQGHYSGVWDCVLRLKSEHGARVFVRYCSLSSDQQISFFVRRGLSPALLRAFPLHAVIFLAYEAVMGFFHSDKH